jgi:hypothetical protein
MATTVTAYRVVPFVVFNAPLAAIERFVTVDGVEQSTERVALFVSHAHAAAAITLPEFSTQTAED